MKKSICIIITIIILLSFIGVNNEASATTYNNKSVAIKWTEKHYKGYKIKVVKYNCVPTKRKSNKTIYIETLPTISDGGYNGHCTINGAYVRYSKKVPKGTKQTCYCVWNPKNNACDDVVAFANCNTTK